MTVSYVNQLNNSNAFFEPSSPPIGAEVLSNSPTVEKRNMRPLHNACGAAYRRIHTPATAIICLPAHIQHRPASAAPHPAASFSSQQSRPSAAAGGAIISRLQAGRSASAGASSSDDDDADDDNAAAAGSAGGGQQKPLRAERLLSNLGYGGRKECATMVKRQRLVFASTGQPLKVGEKAVAGDVLLDGQPLDPPPPLTLLLHKPVGYVVTSPEDKGVTDPVIYDLLPHRFGRRRPFLSAVGRLDKETSGLLLLTDDGKLLHSIQSPSRGIWKRYRTLLAEPLVGAAAAAAVRQFGSGRMLLQGDRSPLLPALLEMADETTAEVAICEGRYHQIRRMFAALGHEVVGLHRHTIGGLQLAETDLAEGAWRLATAQDVAAVLSGPDLTPGGTSSSSSSRAPRASWQGGVEEAAEAGEATEDEEAAAELDPERQQEQLVFRKRYRESSKWVRRRAAIARGVQAMALQSSSSGSSDRQQDADER